MGLHILQDFPQNGLAFIGSVCRDFGGKSDEESACLAA